jgi:hypothetical protein
VAALDAGGGEDTVLLHHFNRLGTFVPHVSGRGGRDCTAVEKRHRCRIVGP